MTNLLPLSNLPVIEVSEMRRLHNNRPSELHEELLAKCIATIEGMQTILAEDGQIEITFPGGDKEIFKGSHLELLRGFPRAYVRGEGSNSMFVIEVMLVVV